MHVFFLSSLAAGDDDSVYSNIFISIRMLVVYVLRTVAAVAS